MHPDPVITTASFQQDAQEKRKHVVILVEAAQHAGSGTLGEPSANGGTPNWNAGTSPNW